MTVGPADDPDTVVGPVIDARARAADRGATSGSPRPRGTSCSRSTSARWPREGNYVGPHDRRRRPPRRPDRPGGNLRAGPRRPPRRRPRRGPRDRQRHRLRPDRRPLLAQPREHRAGQARASASATSTSTGPITGALVDRQPFGGFKLSGIGTKAGGTDYLLEFLLTRTVTENTLRRGFAPRRSSPRQPDEVALGV